MQSTKRIMLLASLTLALTGCALFGGRPVILAANTPCSELVPKTWLNGVAGAPEPTPAGPEPSAIVEKLAQAITELKKWVGFGVDESSRREQANGRTVDAVGIIQRCEERDAKAVAAAKPKFLGVF